MRPGGFLHSWKRGPTPLFYEDHPPPPYLAYRSYFSLKLKLKPPFPLLSLLSYFFGWMNDCATFVLLLNDITRRILMCVFIHLSVSPSIPHAPYLRIHTSCDHNFWYTRVKWWYLQAFFFFFFEFFSKLIHQVDNGVKWQKILSVILDISGNICHMIFIYSIHV